MRPRISIRGSIRPSVGPSVGPSVCLSISRSVRQSILLFLNAEIGKSDKSKPANLTNLTDFDKDESLLERACYYTMLAFTQVIQVIYDRTHIYYVHNIQFQFIEMELNISFSSLCFLF